MLQRLYGSNGDARNAAPPDGVVPETTMYDPNRLLEIPASQISAPEWVTSSLDGSLWIVRHSTGGTPTESMFHASIDADNALTVVPVALPSRWGLTVGRGPEWIMSDTTLAFVHSGAVRFVEIDTSPDSGDENTYYLLDRERWMSISSDVCHGVFAKRSSMFPEHPFGIDEENHDRQFMPSLLSLQPVSGGILVMPNTIIDVAGAMDALGIELGAGSGSYYRGVASPIPCATAGGTELFLHGGGGMVRVGYGATGIKELRKAMLYTRTFEFTPEGIKKRALGAAYSRSGDRIECRMEHASNANMKRTVCAVSASGFMLATLWENTNSFSPHGQTYFATGSALSPNSLGIAAVRFNNDAGKTITLHESSSGSDFVEIACGKLLRATMSGTVHRMHYFLRDVIGADDESSLIVRTGGDYRSPYLSWVAGLGSAEYPIAKSPQTLPMKNAIVSIRNASALATFTEGDFKHSRIGMSLPYSTIEHNSGLVTKGDAVGVVSVTAGENGDGCILWGGMFPHDVKGAPTIGRTPELAEIYRDIVVPVSLKIYGDSRTFETPNGNAVLYDCVIGGDARRLYLSGYPTSTTDIEQSQNIDLLKQIYAYNFRTQLFELIVAPSKSALNWSQCGTATEFVGEFPIGTPLPPSVDWYSLYLSGIRYAGPPTDYSRVGFAYQKFHHSYYFETSPWPGSVYIYGVVDEYRTGTIMADFGGFYTEEVSPHKDDWLANEIGSRKTMAVVSERAKDRPGSATGKGLIGPLRVSFTMAPYVQGPSGYYYRPPVTIFSPDIDDALFYFIRGTTGEFYDFWPFRLPGVAVGDATWVQLEKGATHWPTPASTYSFDMGGGTTRYTTYFFNGPAGPVLKDPDDEKWYSAWGVSGDTSFQQKYTLTIEVRPGAPASKQFLFVCDYPFDQETDTMANDM